MKLVDKVPGFPAATHCSSCCRFTDLLLPVYLCDGVSPSIFLFVSIQQELQFHGL